MLVFLLQTCRSSLENATVQVVDYTTFTEWVEVGYVADVDMEASVYTFTLKEGAPPLKEMLNQLSDTYGNGALNSLFNQFDPKDLESAASSSVKFQVGPVGDPDVVQRLLDNGVVIHKDPVTEEQYMISAIVSYVVPIVLMVFINLDIA